MRPGSSISSDSSSARAPLGQGRILRLWWPLALSWLLMGVELPLFTACVARMDDPKIHLAAYGSVVFPIALVIEAPIIMLLAASTALAADRAAWRRIERCMHIWSACLTALHVLVAFTPLFDLVARRLIGAPEEVIEPARIGLRIMTPWTWSIAYRRAHQGVLIRSEHGRPVILGTLVRLGANALVFLVGWRAGGTSGIVVGTSAVAAGVVCEALFIGWCARPVLSERILAREPTGAPLDLASFLRFYAPLALVPLIAMLTQPLGAAAMARMPLAFDSLAAWPAVHGLVFLTRSVGFAYNEVVVSLLDQPGAVRALRRFGWRLGAITGGILLVVAWTPLARLWFAGVSGLPDEIASLAASALALAAFLPACQAVQSWYQGVLVRSHATRAATEATLAFLVVAAAGLFAGVVVGRASGLACALIALSIASLVQSGWLAFRARPFVRSWAGSP
jgi:hypothetical protein